MPAKQIAVLRVTDGSVVHYPEDAWAMRVITPDNKGKTTTWGDELPNERWKGWQKGRPTGVGNISGSDTFRLRCAEPGQLVFLRTTDWVPEKKRPPGASPQLIAEAELFVVSGRDQHSDATPQDFLDRIVYSRWPADRHSSRRDVWPPPDCIRWELSPYTNWRPDARRKTASEVSVLAGLPTFGKRQPVVQMPGNMLCVPVRGKRALELGVAAHLQPLDTPGRVRLFSSGGATLGSVWQMGSVAPGEWDKMILPGRNAMKFDPLEDAKSMGMCAYTPGYMGDMDLWGAVVLLFSKVDSTSFALPLPDLKPSEPAYWQHTPVVW